MPRGIDEVELVSLTIFSLVIQGDRLCLDGDATLALYIHRVEHLLLELAIGQAAADLDDAIREGRLAMIDVGDDREVTDQAQVFARCVVAHAQSSGSWYASRRPSGKARWVGRLEKECRHCTGKGSTGTATPPGRSFQRTTGPAGPVDGVE